MEEKDHRPAGNTDPNQEADHPSEKKGKNRSTKINAPKPFDVQEIESLVGDPKIPVENGGTVGDLSKRLDPLERAERLEKMTMRRHITFTILGLSTVWIIAGLGYFYWKGNPTLLLTAFPLGIPLIIIMVFFFETRWTQKVAQIMTRTPR